MIWKSIKDGISTLMQKYFSGKETDYCNMDTEKWLRLLEMI